MKNQIEKHLCLGSIILFGLVINISSCGPTNPTFLSMEVKQTQTRSASETLDVTDLPARTNSPTRTSSPYTVVTVTPNWEAMAIGNKELVEKLDDIPGCKLPCWWGITPGKTEWKQLKNIFSDIHAEIFRKPQDETNRQVAEVIVPVFIDELVNLLSIKVILKGDVVQQISPGETFGTHFSNLGYFLSENGRPDEVWIHSLQSNLGGPPPFDVWLFYWEKGFAAEFSRSEKTASYDGEVIKACIERGPILFLWSDPVKSVSEAEKFTSLDFGEPYYPIIPIDEAVGINIKQFYENYKENAGKTQVVCFSSNRSIWPEP